MRDYRPPLAIGRLVAGTLLISLSVLAAIIYSGNSGTPSHERRSSSTAEISNTRLFGQLLGEYVDLDSPSNHGKRDSGSDGLPSVIVPPTPSKISPSLATPFVNLTSSLNAVTSAIIPGPASSDGAPVLTQLEPATPLGPSLLPTADQSGGLAGQLGNALTSGGPAQANGVKAAVASQLAPVVDEVQPAAINLTLANAVDSGAGATPDALNNAEGLLKGIDSSIDSVVQDKVVDIGGARPTGMVGDLKNALQSGLNDIATATDGPADLVCSLIVENVCGVVEAIDNVVHSAAGICSSMASAISVTEQPEPLIPNNPATVPAASPTPDGAGGLLPTDLPPLPAPPGSLPLPLPTNTGADGASVTAFGVGPPAGGAGPEPVLTNPVPTNDPGAAPGFPSAPPTPFPAARVPSGITAGGGSYSQICS